MASLLDLDALTDLYTLSTWETRKEFSIVNNSVNKRKSVFRAIRYRLKLNVFHSLYMSRHVHMGGFRKGRHLYDLITKLCFILLHDL